MEKQPNLKQNCQKKKTPFTIDQIGKYFSGMFLSFIGLNYIAITVFFL